MKTAIPAQVRGRIIPAPRVTKSAALVTASLVSLAVLILYAMGLVLF